MDRGFKVMPFGDFRKLGVSTMNPRPHVVFVNRREAFTPPKDLLARTDDLIRRKKSDPNIDPYRRGGYDREYRYMVTRSSAALKQLREIASISKKRQVLMVNDKDRPDAEILVSIAQTMMNNEVWR